MWSTSYSITISTSARLSNDPSDTFVALHHFGILNIFNNLDVPIILILFLFIFNFGKFASVIMKFSNSILWKSFPNFINFFQLI